MGVRLRGGALQRHGHGRVRLPGRGRRVCGVVRQPRHVRGVAGVRRVRRERGVRGERGMVQRRRRTVPRGPLGPPRAAHAADGRLLAIRRRLLSRRFLLYLSVERHTLSKPRFRSHWRGPYEQFHTNSNCVFD